jgi:hypothetical protein
MSVEDYQRHKRRDRRMLRLVEFTHEDIAAIAQAKVPAEYAGLLL